MPWSDADEVDVRLVGIGLREEADEERHELALVVLGDEARPLEMEEEQLRQHRRHVPAAPPGVDVLDDATVVGRARVPYRRRHRRRHVRSRPLVARRATDPCSERRRRSDRSSSSRDPTRSAQIVLGRIVVGLGGLLAVRSPALALTSPSITVISTSDSPSSPVELLACGRRRSSSPPRARGRARSPRADPRSGAGSRGAAGGRPSPGRSPARRAAPSRRR